MVPFYPDKNFDFLKNMVQQTSIIKRGISCLNDTIYVFQVYPKISKNLVGENWISIGETAVSFDPISGEGVGNSLKTAILSLVIRATVNEKSSSFEFLDHYCLKSRYVLFSHLQTCLKYYLSTFSSSKLWDKETLNMTNSIRNFLRTDRKTLRYRLNGFDLQKIM